MDPAGDLQKHASQAAQISEPGANAKPYCRTHEATVPAVGFVLVLALPVVLGFLPLWVAISFHEGSTLLLVLNSLKLHQWRQNSPDFACIWVDEDGTLGACL